MSTIHASDFSQQIGSRPCRRRFFKQRMEFRCALDVEMCIQSRRMCRHRFVEAGQCCNPDLIWRRGNSCILLVPTTATGQQQKQTQKPYAYCGKCPFVPVHWPHYPLLPRFVPEFLDLFAIHEDCEHQPPWVPPEVVSGGRRGREIHAQGECLVTGPEHPVSLHYRLGR